MKIYVNVTDGTGLCAWYNHDPASGLSYLHDSAELQDWNIGEFAGAAFDSVKAAKAAGGKAKSLAAFDGAINPKVKFYQQIKGKQVEVKFTKDGKIKQ